MYETILVPLDGSKLAEAVLPAAVALVKPTGRLVLMRVVPDLWIDDPLTPEQVEEYMTRVKHDCQKYLDGIAETVRQDGLRVEVRVASGEPAAQILEAVDTAHCNLIAMATHGHSGLQRLMLGSVTDKVMQQSSIPVLLVRPPEIGDTPLAIDLEANQFDPKVTPWQIKSVDMPDGDAPARLRHLLRYAILAPSTHNTQPWKFVIDPVSANEIRVYADRARWLRVADVDEREMFVSVGCALENLLIAAEHYGYGHTVTLLPDATDRDLIALVHLSASSRHSPHRAGLFECIPLRFSNHGTYSGLPIDANLLSMLLHLCVEPNLEPLMISDEVTRRKINALVLRADAAQFSDPAFREELGRQMGQGAYGAPWFIAKLQQMAVTLVNLGESAARRDSQALLSAPVFGIIATHGDDRASQVQAGQLYERMHLLATRLNLSMQPMNQLLQQQDYKSALSDVIFADQPSAAHPTPQIAFRLGYGQTKVEHTPRRPLEEVLSL